MATTTSDKFRGVPTHYVREMKGGNMTRDDVFKDYDVNDRGRICSPGKFEGEPCYAPYFWDMMSYADRDNGSVIGFNISPEDRAKFPEIPTRRRTINLEEDEQGFVNTDH